MPIKRAINPNFAHLYQIYEYNKSIDFSNPLIALLLGSSRSGKTISFVDWSILYCLLPENTNKTIFLIRDTYNSHKTTLYVDFDKRLRDFQMDSPFAKAKEVSQFNIFDNTFYFKGCDNPKSFEGAGCDVAYFNEVFDIQKVYFDAVEQRCKEMIVADSNPKYHESWIYDNLLKRPEVKMLHSTFADNPFCPPAQKRKILSYAPTPENIAAGTADEYRWQVYGLGQRCNLKTGYEFYSKFSRGRTVKKLQVNPNLPIHVSFDFNVSPYICAGIFQVVKVGGKYHALLVKEFTLENPLNNTYDLSVTIRKWIEDNFKHRTPLRIYGDASGSHQSTRNKDNEYDIITRELRKYCDNNTMQVPRSNPRLKGRRNFMNKVLSGQHPYIEFYISDTCKKTIEDFENVIEAPDGGKLKKRVKDAETGLTYEPFGHTSDFCDYFMVEMFGKFFEY